MNADLTLEKALTPACQRRACQEIKFAVVRGVEARSLTLTISILTKQLQRQKGERAQQQQRHRPAYQEQKQVSTSKTCSRCGKSPCHNLVSCSQTLSLLPLLCNVPGKSLVVFSSVLV